MKIKKKIFILLFPLLIILFIACDADMRRFNNYEYCIKSGLESFQYYNNWDDDTKENFDIQFEKFSTKIIDGCISIYNIKK